MYPGILGANFEIKHAVPKEETFESLIEKGVLAIDVGAGPLDHHGKDLCASELVAQHLGVEKNPAIARLVQYARRDDREGKGTLSSDAIDRAFGLSGLISSLNKAHITDPAFVIKSILPLLAAHYQSAREHHIELPLEVARKKQEGLYEEVELRQGDKKLTLACVVSDKPSMPTYLRSQHGPHADVVLQKSESTNHMSILTRQERKIDLSMAMALIRLREAQIQGVELENDPVYLGKTGRIDEVPQWYFDPATNSLLNGGAHNTVVEAAHIDWDEIKKIVKTGIEIGGKK